MLEAGNFDDFAACLVHTQIDQRLNLEAITVNFHVVKAVLPESVVAIAQIAEMCAEKYVRQRTQ